MLPFACPSPLAEPPELGPLREQGGLARVRTSTGDLAWLVTGYADVKALGTDRRIGKSHPDPGRAPRLWDAAILGPEENHETAVADHRRWRHTLTDGFAARRIERLRPRLQASSDHLVEALAAAGPPADLCAGLARPFALAAICDLIGVPEPGRRQFADWSDRVRERGAASGTAERRQELNHYLDGLLDLRRRHPADDLISALAAREESPESLRRHELPDALSGILLAGYETVASRIPYGVLYLLAHHEAGEAVAADPAAVPGAVEEIMRLAVPGGSWMPRYARTDLEYRGARISAGDLVVFSFQSANRDERVFPDAGTFDPGRSPNPHLAFGYGKYFCLGAGLARLELQLVLESLARRLPGLRLGCRPEELRLSEERVTGGLRELPVTWG